MTDQQLVIKIISTLAIVVPIAINLIKIRTAGLLGWLFLFFLLTGFGVDLLMWHLHTNSIKGVAAAVFTFYSLIEALFFFWLIQYLAEPILLKWTARFFLYATLPLWIIGFFVYPFFIEGESAQGIPFNTAYEIISSFLSGFALLYLVEKERNILKSASFWFFAGIFFYCFCTFFIMTLLGSFVSLSLWFLNNIINMITYAFYSFGLWNYKSSKHQH